MRKSWIAVAMIALLVGLAAGYRMGRAGNPQRGLARASRASVAPSESPGAHQDSGASLETAQSAPDSPDGRPLWQPGARDDVARSSRSSEDDKPALRTSAAGQGSIGTPGSAEIAPRDAAASSGVPARIESGQTSSAPLGEKVSPPVVPPVPYPTLPPTTAAASKQEPAEGDGTTPPADDPDSDRHPPVLQYLRFDPAEVQDGGVTVLSVGTSDDLSGVKAVFGLLRSPSEAASVPFAAQDVTGDGVLTARIAIPRQAETGEWFVGTLQIVDKADNPLILAFAKTTIPQGGALLVFSEESDSSAPIVTRVSIDKVAVGAGENNQVIVDVDDDRSGVASVAGTFESPSKSASVPFACRPSSESSWVGDVPIPANAECGEWILRELRVADKANNTAYLASDSPKVGRVSFVVSGGGACDSDPPVIDALYVSPPVVSNTAASEIVLTVTAHDDGSGVSSFWGRFEGPVSSSGQAPKIFFTCQADPKDREAPMTARLTVPQFAATGIWRVTFAQLVDTARNARTYSRDDPALVDASFTVD